MKVCAISDLHGDLPSNIEPCDIVCICGDISPLKLQHSVPKMKNWILQEFLPWAENLPCDKVFYIAGNHDYIFTKWTPEDTIKIKYLQDSLYEYIHEDKVYTIYGTPWCKLFGNWSFMMSDETLSKTYSFIPENVDILMTHDAPWGCNDIILQDVVWNTGEHIGNTPLRVAILKKNPKYVVRGHLHSCSHDWGLLGDSKVVNCSIKDEHYNVVYDPIYFEI